MDSRDFLNSVIKPYVTSLLDQLMLTRWQQTRLGWIDLSYTTGLPSVRFDGEEAASPQTFTYLAPYVPVAGDKVLLLHTGRTWVIVGKVVTA